jgi:hypothetical protein
MVIYASYNNKINVSLFDFFLANCVIRIDIKMSIMSGRDCWCWKFFESELEFEVFIACII